MTRRNAVINLASRIVDAVIYPVYLVYAALLFRVLGLEDVPDDRTPRIADDHTAELADGRTG